MCCIYIGCKSIFHDCIRCAYSKVSSCMHGGCFIYSALSVTHSSTSGKLKCLVSRHVLSTIFMLLYNYIDTMYLVNTVLNTE